MVLTRRQMATRQDVKEGNEDSFCSNHKRVETQHQVELDDDDELSHHRRSHRPTAQNSIFWWGSLALVVYLIVMHRLGVVTVRDAEESRLLLIQQQETATSARQKKKKVPPVLQKIWKGTQRLAGRVKRVVRARRPGAVKAPPKPKEAVTLMKEFNISIEDYPTAYTDEPILDSSEVEFLEEFSQDVQEHIPDLQHRIPAVDWGTSQPWWDAGHDHSHEHGDGGAKARHKKQGRQQIHYLDRIEGGHLLWRYYRIIKSHMKNPPYDLSTVYFPFRLCKKGGCPAHVALKHSLEWRERYQPWRVTPSTIAENSDGFVYTRGFSKASPANPHYGRHAVLFARPGGHKAVDPLAYFRAIFHSVDKAVAEALHHSHGKVGKVNVIIDGEHKWGSLPSLHYLKQAVTMFQDHFPDRLGCVLLCNLSRPAEFVISLVKPLITKEVRDKIYILSHDPEKRLAQLQAVIEADFIPDWLAGTDTYRFDATSYYPKQIHFSDDEGRKFIEAMPYHAH